MKRIKDMLAFCGRLDRGFYPVMLLGALLETLTGFGILLISSTILNLLAAGKDAETILTLTAAMTLGFGLLQWIKNAVNQYKNYRMTRLVYRYQQFITEQVLQAPYQYLEQEKFVETLNQVRQNEDVYDLTGSILNKVYEIARNSFSVLVAAFSFLQLFGTVKHLGDSVFLVTMLILALFLLIVSSTGYIVWRRKKNAQSMEKLMEEMVQRNKVAMYLINDVIARYPVGKHIRLYGMQERLLQEEEKQDRGFEEMNTNIDRLEIKPGLAGDISSVAISAMIYLTVSAVALAGGLGAGSVIWYAGVVQQLLDCVRQLINTVSFLYSDCTRQQALFQLIDLTKTKKETPAGQECHIKPLPEHCLEFENVSFAYPDTEKMVLQNLDLRLSGRERVALVGRNGCGKSTLIKLICRLYDPTEGRILLDGVDIRKIPRKEYASFLSVVFQDYQIFAATLGENIALAAGADPSQIQNSAKKVGLKYTHPDTPLRRDLDEKGIEVSGGEGQKIALARALYKNAPMVLLDEPTASLDPISESEIYEKFHSLVEGKLAMFISHRLSSCRFCDRILVLQDGKIIQDGSHEILEAQQGCLYREMWQAQSQYYT